MEIYDYSLICLILCLGYMITFKKPDADVFDLIPKCFWRLPPPNYSLPSIIAIPPRF